MEREKVKEGSGSAVAKATCWDVVWGSMDDVVTCDSSLSTSDSDPDSNSDLKSKPFVVLRRPQSDSGPCEITIDFEQHHEIKQVYVRSSARVYEIYYAASTKADNHYLCTVRCGAIPSHQILSSHTLDEAHSATPNDDGWVDLKPKPQQTSMPMQNPLFQYLFEATAEVADADPVLSVTLRLLSIQSGDYVRIDEVYVFTDPVVSADDMDSTENSSGNALMSMLIPTLMQLSKSRMSQIQERNDTSPGEIEQQEKVENKSNSAGFTSNALQSTMLNIDMSKPRVPFQKPDPISSPPVTCRDTLSNHIERSLDELVSRVANIEQFCLKFEEKLLAPISNMEARLVKIEQQLESFVSPQNCRTSCTGISAPESESNYMYNDGIESHLTSTNMDDRLVQEPSNTPSDTSVAPCFVQSLSTTLPHLLPSLVVTAPNFSNIDDVEENDTAPDFSNIDDVEENDTAPDFSNIDVEENDTAPDFSNLDDVEENDTAPDFSNLDDVEENDTTGTVKNSSNECPNKPSSLSDALASALAGFLSSASTDSLKCSFKVEDCTCPEGSKITPLPDFSQSDETVPPSIHVNEANKISYMEQGSPTQGEDKQEYDLEEDGNKKQADSYVEKVIVINKDPVEVGFVGSDDDRNLYLDSAVPVSSGPSEKDSTCTLQVPGSCTDTCKVTNDALDNILNMSSPAVLDFRTCLLDVEFSLQEDSSAKPPLEALLTDMRVFHRDEVQSVKEINETSFGGKNDLVLIGTEMSATSENNNEIWLPNTDFGCMSSNTEHEVQDFHDCSHASLI